MERTIRHSLWGALSSSSNAFLDSSEQRISWSDLISGSCLKGRGEELRGRSILIATEDQSLAALALIELDGIARRIVVCPSGLPDHHLSFVLETAQVDGLISERPLAGAEFFECGFTIVRADYDRAAPLETEWILLTSGTTGRPKLVAHTLASLTGAIDAEGSSEDKTVWSTFYDIRRYGGLQIFLRALLTGSTLVLSGAQDQVSDFLNRAGALEVSHISGTPTHWRRALMSPAAHRIAPKYVRLSGEIADQGILNKLQGFYPGAKVAHAFASTEAGVAFAVNDGVAGFPGNFVGHTTGVEMKVQDGSLRIRSARTANCYLGDEKRLKDEDGFVDTGDMLELLHDRYYFIGRRDGVINVGGMKVHPEEVESVINRHPGVRMSLVHTRNNPITGSLVVANVVLNEPAENGVQNIQQEIVTLCRAALPPHKVPVSIRVVPALAVGETGKLVRSGA